MPAPSCPRVSVVIPCCNLGQFLPEAIASVRRQTFSDFEIVIVDDGSTDGETAIALEAAAGPGVQLVRSENRGLSAARNLGISQARGEYLSCLDADDLFEPEWLELAVACLDANPDLAFVSHWLRAFGDEEWDWTPGRGDLAALLDHNVFNGAALFRRRITDAVGGFDESMRDGCEDWEFWIRVLAAGYRGATIPEFLYRYRRRPESMSRVMHSADRWFDVYGGVIDKHRETYRPHLLDLLIRREWSIARLCHGIDRVQTELSTMLEPAVQERRQEVERARARLSEQQAREELAEEVATLRAHAQALEEVNLALERQRSSAEQRIEDLHKSWSWRLTLPLRRVYEWLAWMTRKPS